jgi:selenocysteine-specific elongation factor
VPGHIDFIKNMLAGVGGIDAALLVIAADEGVMPQTREHLAILDLLAVPAGVVALTKTDLIDDPDWLDLVELDVAEVLSGTRLAAAPIVRVSAATGAGLMLAPRAGGAARAAAAPQPQPAAPAHRPRLHPERAGHHRHRHAQRRAAGGGGGGGRYCPPG